MPLSRDALRRKYSQRASVRKNVTKTHRGYICPICDVLLADGVEYAFCPGCNTAVDWVDTRLPIYACPTCDAMTNTIGPVPHCDPCKGRLLLVHDPARFAEQDPSDDISMFDVFYSPWFLFAVWVASLVPVVMLATHPMFRAAMLAMAGPLVLLPVLISISFLGAFGSQLSELRALLTQKTRIVHGLEHATLKLIEESGTEVSGGLTLSERSFEMYFPNDQRVTPSAVRRAFRKAVQRIQDGETDLVYDRRCGTSLLVGALSFATIGVLVGAIGLFFTLPVKVLFAGLAVVVVLPIVFVRSLGLAAQRLFTVSHRFAKASPVKVIRRGPLDDLLRYEVVVSIDEC